MQKAAQAISPRRKLRHAEDPRPLLKTKIPVQETLLTLPHQLAQTHCTPSQAHQALVLPILEINPIDDPQLPPAQVKPDHLLPPAAHKAHARTQQVYRFFIEFLLKKMPQTNPNHRRQYCPAIVGDQVQHAYRPVQDHHQKLPTCPDHEQHQHH